MSRKYRKLDLKQFDDFKDNQDIAYVLGIIATDGCIHKHMGTERLNITFQVADLSLLNKIKKILKVDNPIVLMKSRYVSLTINTPGLVKSFKRFNITPKKSHTLTFPDIISKEMHRHFLRGCWDGDGTIVFNFNERKRKFNQTVRLVSGSKEFIEGVSEVLTKNKISFYKSKEMRCRGNRKPLYSLCIRTSSFKDFYDFLYKDSKTLLCRKKAKFKELLKHREDNYSSSGKFTFRDRKFKLALSSKVLDSLIAKKDTVLNTSKRLKIEKSVIYSHLRKYRKTIT